MIVNHTYRKYGQLFIFFTQLCYIKKHIIQQSTARVPGIMALIYPLIQDTKLGLGVSPSTTNLPSTTYSNHLADEVYSLISHRSCLYLLSPSAPNRKLLLVSMLQVHLVTQPWLSIVLSNYSLVHKGHNTLRLMSSYSQLQF